MPSADELIAAWGDPLTINMMFVKDWKERGLFIPPQWAFHPSNYWFWEFEGKCVSVLIDRPLGRGYKPCVWKMRVDGNPCFKKEIEEERR